MHLVDTNVISELRKAKAGNADKNVVRWASSVPETGLFLSVISLMELEVGVQRMERRNPGQGKALRVWLEQQVLPFFSDRILAVNVDVARRCARLHVPNRLPDRDALIAATALVHSLTVVTRNTGDFEPAGVPLLNPWDGGLFANNL